MTAGIIVWCAAPVLALVVLGVRAANATIVDTKLVSAQVELNREEVTRPVGVALSWGGEKTLVAPAWEGLVQSTKIAPGDDLEEGSVIAVIGGITRTAAITPEPFSRVLAAGDTSTDAEMLNAFLARRGLAAPTSSTVDSQTLSAVRQFADSIGVSGAQQVTQFDPAWVDFLSRPARVESITLRVAAPAPPPGQDVATLAPTLTNAVLVDATNGSSGDVTNNGSATGAPATATPTITAEPGEKLLVSGVEIGLSENSQSVSRDSFDVLVSLATPSMAAATAVLSLGRGAEPWPRCWRMVSTDGQFGCGT